MQTLIRCCHFYLAVCLIAAIVVITKLPAGEQVAGPGVPPLPRIAPVKAVGVAQTFRLQHGFKLDLLAAEPLTTDPVAIDYDENGLAFVAEMSDYPYTDKSTDRPFVERTSDLPIGRIRVLEDQDGDGQFDRSTVFADQLSWPTGLAFWKGGVFVAATPDIWYLKDTDGDHIADIRRKVFTGFRKFNVQAVMNNLKWSLDNHIVGAGSSNGGTLSHLDRPDQKPLVLGRDDFQFDPRNEHLQLISGGARFGNTSNDQGERFLCNIRNPVQHVVLPRRYLARNPLLSVSNTVHDAARSGDTLPVFRISPVEPWRDIRAKRWVAETGQNYPRSETYADGYFTSSSGVTIYRGAAYPPEFYGNAFLGEVAANAIHRQTVHAAGATYVANRADEGVEFIASTDNWFRPVNFVNAPDGTLHVLDMYRETIEHPWSIPDDIKALVDLESGRDRGRIYRITPPGFRVPKPPRLGSATTPELVATLSNPNSWWRETAQRLLFERQDPQAVPLLQARLRQVDTEVNSSNDHHLQATIRGQRLGRLHALWSLDGLRAVTEQDLNVALADGFAPVREHAIRLAESFLDTSPTLRQQLLQLADDPEPRVRFQLAFTCGSSTNIDSEPSIREALCRLILRDAADPWIKVAILSSLQGRSAEVAADLIERLHHVPQPDAATKSVLREIVMYATANQDEVALNRLRTAAAMLPKEQAATRLTVVAGILDGRKRAGKPLTATNISEPSPLTELLQKTRREAESIVLDPQADPDQRLVALTFQALKPPAQARPVLESLLDIHQPVELQLSALKLLVSLPGEPVIPDLISRYRNFSPSLQAEIVEALLARPERLPVLFEAIEKRVILPTQVSSARRAGLFKHTDESIRNRAMALLASSLPGPRDEVLKAYRAALSLPADRDLGMVVLKRECATCHRWRGEGQEVGPHLETIRNRTAEEILIHILDPNREVSPNYVEYVVALKDGRTASGVIVAETAGSITLRKPEGRQEIVLRQDIEELASSNKSLMPEGLEKKITIPEMAALLMQLLSPKTPTSPATSVK